MAGELPWRFVREKAVTALDRLQRFKEWRASPVDEGRSQVAAQFGFSDDPALEGQLLRSWWQAVADAFARMARMAAAGEAIDPVPAELFRVMGGLSAYVATGKLPEPIEMAVKRGRTAMGPSEKRDIGLAVAYQRACNGGFEHNGVLLKIKDRAFNRTISEAFGVDKTTARHWCAEIDPAVMPVNDISADTLADMMRGAGANYRQAGRSNSSISTRGSKMRS